MKKIVPKAKSTPVEVKAPPKVVNVPNKSKTPVGAPEVKKPEPKAVKVAEVKAPEAAPPKKVVVSTKAKVVVAKKEEVPAKTPEKAPVVVKKPSEKVVPVPVTVKKPEPLKEEAKPIKKNVGKRITTPPVSVEPVEDEFQFEDEVVTPTGTYKAVKSLKDFHKVFAKENTGMFPYRLLAQEDGELTEFAVVFVTKDWLHVIDVSSEGEDAESHGIYAAESVEKGLLEDTGTPVQLYKLTFPEPKKK